MTSFTADELVVMVKARDLLYSKLMADKANERVEWAHSALLDVLRYSVLDTA